MTFKAPHKMLDEKFEQIPTAALFDIRRYEEAAHSGHVLRPATEAPLASRKERRDLPRKFEA